MDRYGLGIKSACECVTDLPVAAGHKCHYHCIHCAYLMNGVLIKRFVFQRLCVRRVLDIKIHTHSVTQMVNSHTDTS